MAREFSLLIDKNCTMEGLVANASLQGSGQMGRVDLTVVVARTSGKGGMKDEGHFLHVEAARQNRFDDQNPIGTIAYGRTMRNRCNVTKCTVLKA